MFVGGYLFDMKDLWLFSIFLFAACSAPTSDASRCTSPTYDGYVYEVVEIGDQCWFAENLRSSRYANGDSIFYCPLRTCYEEWRTAESNGMRIEYEDDPEQAAVTGQLYNYWAVTDPRGLCPNGWTVPKKSDWNALMIELGGEDVFWNEQAFAEMESALLAPSEDWIDDEFNNSSGMGILPGGKFSPNGKLFSMTSYGAYLWTSSQVAESSGWSVEFGRGREVFNPGTYSKHALSVRCLKVSEPAH